jgi:uncharacterized protein
MSDGRLPERIDPIRLAEGKRILSGVLDLGALSRLAGYITEGQGTVRVEMEFGVDEEGIRFARGHLTTEVGIACQRCLESFRLPLESNFQLGIVTSEALAERLPEHYDPLIVGAEPFFLRDMVEDELILSLPIVPKHPDDHCPVRTAEEQENEGEPLRENPFSVLAQLKKNRNS